MKKLAIVLIIAIVFSFLASCSSKEITSNESGKPIPENETSSQIQTAEKVFSLPYFESDSLNPYNATQTANFYLTSLIFEPLYTVDKNFSPVPVLAESAEFIENTCVVELKKGALFSDGTLVEISDILRSFTLAKNSKYYSSRLSNVSTLGTKDGKLIFNLKRLDKNFLTNLSFPIIKGGSQEDYAIGSGRYMIDIESKPIKLEANPNAVRGISKDIQSISLVGIHQYSTLSYMIKIGSANFIYTPPDLEINAASTKTSQVLTNNIVYLGVNSNNLYLQNQDFRKALSLCVNRKSILTDIYAGAGSATALPFNPNAKALNSDEFTVKLTDTSATAELLTLCGYSQKGENGIYLVADNEVRLRLAVNSENLSRVKAAEMIKLNFEAVGVGVDIISEPVEAYKARIASGDYDLFIGETKLAPDNDISPLLTVGNLNACNDMGQTQLSYLEYLSGTITLEDFLRKFDLATPFIPILYRNGTSVFSGTISGNQTVTEYDVFASIDKWEF